MNCFDIEYILIDAKPEFYLSKEKIILFEYMLDLHDYKQIYDNINKYFDIQIHLISHSYIFINNLIGQYSKFKRNMIFINNKGNYTSEVIDYFKKCTEYFTQGSFANLMMNSNLINIMN